MPIFRDKDNNPYDSRVFYANRIVGDDGFSTSVPFNFASLQRTGALTGHLYSGEIEWLSGTQKRQKALLDDHLAWHDATLEEIAVSYLIFWSNYSLPLIIYRQGLAIYEGHLQSFITNPIYRFLLNFFLNIANLWYLSHLFPIQCSILRRQSPR